MGDDAPPNTLADLPPGKSTLYPLSRGGGGPQSQSGCIGEEKISCPYQN